MINAQAPGIVVPERVAPPMKRIGPRTFLFLCALEGLLIAAIFLFVVYALAPQHVPLARSSDYATVREAIWARLNGTIDDPLVEVTAGVSTRESNVRGFTLHGQIYYYYIEGQRGFDPLSRGAVDFQGIEIVARDEDGPKPLVIYRLRSN
jgi:hypothetical protein